MNTFNNTNDTITVSTNDFLQLVQVVHNLEKMIMNQTRPLQDVHKALFNHPIKTKDQKQREKLEMMKAEVILKGIKKRGR